ncbi:MAG: hypothetical protein B7Z43_07125 [Sphingomonas sp. 12-62-6]|nr:MAG: hypothetical protein B7Z43_07125 [Sphingomonas sp. 12-62-6]
MRGTWLARHAQAYGVAPQEGRNAALELIHQLQLADSLPKFGQGVTVNLTLMNAGSRYNIIPEDASATLNVRIREKKQGEEVDAILQTNAQNRIIPDTKVTVSHEASFPPLPTNASTDALAALADRIYAAAGMTLVHSGNGGASESALSHEAGVPALDGLGPVGTGSHTEGYRRRVSRPEFADATPVSAHQPDHRTRQKSAATGAIG